jgi:hypothetical protein
MYMNGPSAGRIISLPDPPPERITVAVNLVWCEHNMPEGMPMAMTTYKVLKPANPMLPYVITLDSEWDDTGYWCVKCKSQAEVKYKMDKLREILEDDEDDEDEEEW